MYGRSTKVKELYKDGEISQRTLNRLEENGFFDLGQIYDYCGEDTTRLMDLSGMGKKAAIEIRNIINKMGVEGEDLELHIDNIENSGLVDILNEAYKYALTLPNENIEIIKKIYPSALLTHQELIKIADNNFSIYSEYSREVNIGIRLFCLNFAHTTCSLLSEYDDVSALATYQKYLSAESLLATDQTKFTPYEEAIFISQNKGLQELLQYTYEKLAEKCLAQIGINFLNKYLRTFDKIVPYFDRDESAFRDISERKTMRRTFLSLKNLCDQFKVKFLKYCSLSDYDVALELIKLKYPFLDSAQRNLMCEFVSHNGYVPLFFLILNYVRTSSDIRNRVISYNYGFYDSICMKGSDIAKIIGLTRERIRQIKEKRINFDRRDDGNFSIYTKNVGVRVERAINNENLMHYEELFSLPYISSDTPLYLKMKEQEHFDCCFSAFAKILTSICGEFSECDIKGKLFLINTQKIINVNDFKKKLEAVCLNKYYKDTFIPYMKLINVGECLNEENLSFIRYVASCLYNLSAYESGILMLQNGIDIFEELYYIIKEGNSPISLEKIFEAFKNKYPSHKFSEPKQLKSYLNRGINRERISFVGRTSMYVLSDSGHNKYTIRDIVKQMLGDSVDPMRLSEIYGEVSKYYPNTSTNSIATSMKNDKSGCFLEFGDGYWGLKGKEYSPNFEIRTVDKRKDFSTRISMFKNFVDRYHRLPSATTNVGKEEATLCRWYYNIKNELINITDEERSELEEVVNSYQQLGYPQNSTEEKFLRMCEEMERFIRDKHSLPTMSSDKKLHTWYYKAKKRYDSFTDNRRKYLSDLFDFIESFGFNR